MREAGQDPPQRDLCREIWLLGVEAGKQTAGAHWIAVAAVSVVVVLVFAALMLVGWARAEQAQELVRLEHARADTCVEFETQARECAAKLEQVDKLLGIVRARRQ